jgi:hypothetical protein
MDDQDDDRPFAPPPLSPVASSMVGGYDRIAIQAEDRRRFLVAVERWARARGLWTDNGSLAATWPDRGLVTVPLGEMSEYGAMLRASALAPTSLTLSAETITRDWVYWLRTQLGERPPTTGDAAFDERFTLRTSDARATPRLLSDGVRAALLAMDARCALTYARGEIELRLETRRLNGAHVLRAVEAVAAIMRQ